MKRLILAAALLTLSDLSGCDGDPAAIDKLLVLQGAGDLYGAQQNFVDDLQKRRQ